MTYANPDGIVSTGWGSPTAVVVGLGDQILRRPHETLLEANNDEHRRLRKADVKAKAVTCQSLVGRADPER